MMSYSFNVSARVNIENIVLITMSNVLFAFMYLSWLKQRIKLMLIYSFFILLCPVESRSMTGSISGLEHPSFNQNIVGWTLEQFVSFVCLFACFFLFFLFLFLFLFRILIM